MYTVPADPIAAVPLADRRGCQMVGCVGLGFRPPRVTRPRGWGAGELGCWGLFTAGGLCLAGVGRAGAIPGPPGGLIPSEEVSPPAASSACPCGGGGGASSEICHLRSIMVCTCCVASRSPVPLPLVEGSMSCLRLRSISTTVGTIPGLLLDCMAAARATAHTAPKKCGRDGQAANGVPTQATPIFRVPLLLRI